MKYGTAGTIRKQIYPVWYDNETERKYKERSEEYVPKCEHLHIHEWREMIDLLENLDKH